MQMKMQMEKQKQKQLQKQMQLQAKTRAVDKSTERPRPLIKKAREILSLPAVKDASVSSEVSIFEIENAEEFSAADLALFSQPADTDATILENSPSMEYGLQNGNFFAFNAQVDWFATVLTSSLSVTLRMTGGLSTLNPSNQRAFDGSSFKYNIPLSTVNRTPVAISKVQFVPLVYSNGYVTTFRVDFFKTLGSQFSSADPPYDAILNPDGLQVFATQGVALSILVTQTIRGDSFTETVFRARQSADEIALIDGVTDPSSPSTVTFSYNERQESFYDENSVFFFLRPTGTVADLARRGVISSFAPNAILDHMVPIGLGSDEWFTLSSSSTLTGLVATTRVPLAATLHPGSAAIRTTTQQQPLLLWLVAAIALCCALVALHRLRR